MSTTPARSGRVRRLPRRISETPTRSAPVSCRTAIHRHRWSCERDCRDGGPRHGAHRDLRDDNPTSSGPTSRGLDGDQNGATFGWTMGIGAEKKKVDAAWKPSST